MVALHLADVEYMPTVVVTGSAAAGSVGALSVLALIGRPDFAVVKLADAEVALVAGEQVEWQVFVQLPTDLLLRVALCNEVVSS